MSTTLRAVTHWVPKVAERKTKAEWMAEIRRRELQQFTPVDGYQIGLLKRGVIPVTAAESAYDPKDPLWSYRRDLNKRRTS